MSAEVRKKRLELMPRPESATFWAALSSSAARNWCSFLRGSGWLAGLPASLRSS